MSHTTNDPMNEPVIKRLPSAENAQQEMALQTSLSGSNVRTHSPLDASHKMHTAQLQPVKTRPCGAGDTAQHRISDAWTYLVLCISSPVAVFHTHQPPLSPATMANLLSLVMAQARAISSYPFNTRTKSPVRGSGSSSSQLTMSSPLSLVPVWLLLRSIVDQVSVLQ